MLTTFGLCLIVLGWIYQLIFLLKGDKKIKPLFVGIYSLGVLFLILGISPFSFYNFISLNGLSFVIAIITLILILKRK